MADGGPDALAGVLTAALELEHLLAHLDLDEHLGDRVRSLLSEARAASQHGAAADDPSVDKLAWVDRALATYQTLLAAGDSGVRC